MLTTLQWSHQTLDKKLDNNNFFTLSPSSICSCVQSEISNTSLSPLPRCSSLASLLVELVCKAAMLRANPGPVSEWMTADKLKSEPGGQQQSGGKGVTFWQDTFVTLSHSVTQGQGHLHTEPSLHNNAVQIVFGPIVPLEHLLFDSPEVWSI